MFFTDDDIITFLSEYYPAYYNTYKRLPIKIQKIDFFRYIAVYHYGGFYMDLDMTGLYPLDEIRTYKSVFPVDEYIVENMCDNPRYESFVQNGCNFLLGQYAFAAEPKNEFIKLLVDTIHANIDDYVKNADSSENYVYQTTGPDFVTKQYIQYKNQGKIHILDNNKRQYFGRYCRHEYLGTWK
jgi:mannosyltransferase OCH1-like enzyme